MQIVQKAVDRSVGTGERRRMQAGMKAVSRTSKIHVAANN